MLKTAHELVQEARQSLEEQAPEVVHGLLRSPDVMLIDVREPDEYAQGHLPGAISIPRGLLEFRISGEPALQHEDRTVILYCKTGGRAALAALVLRRMGFGRVVSVTGGYEGWVAVGLPVEQPADLSFG